MRRFARMSSEHPHIASLKIVCHRPSMFRVVGINLSIFFGLFIVAELIFGDWISSRDFGALDLPRNVQRTFDVQDLTGGGIITYTRDEFGLRGEYGALADIDVLVVGGSTTNELNVDDDLIWTMVLQKHLRSLDARWSVANAGVDGQSTVGHLYNFKTWFPRLEGLEPKYVLALIGVNDVHVDSQRHHDLLTSPDELNDTVQWLKNNSAFYRMHRTVRGMIEAYDAKIVHGNYEPFTGSWQEVTPEEIEIDDAQKQAVDDYGLRVARLIGQINDFGAQAIIVTQSRSSYRVDNGRVFAEVKEGGSLSLGDYYVQSMFNAAAMRACRSHPEAICVDLGRDLRFEDGDFYDWVHTTASGSARIGGYLFEVLRERITPKT